MTYTEIKNLTNDEFVKLYAQMKYLLSEESKVYKNISND